jgi:hypothetical protein
VPGLFAPGEVSILGAREDGPEHIALVPISSTPLVGLKHASAPSPFFGGGPPSPSPSLAPPRSFAALSTSQPGSAETSFELGAGLGALGADDSQERRAHAAGLGLSLYCSQFDGRVEEDIGDASRLLAEDLDYSRLGGDDDDASAGGHIGSSQEVLREVTIGGGWY